MTGALAGLKVLEIGQWVAAPYCTAILADLGADVIKVERRGTGDDQRLSPPYAGGQSALFNQMNRNKRSLVLDLDLEQDRAVCLQLAGNADVVVSNFRPGTIDRLGLGYDAVASRNPRVIYGLVTGFGLDGPLASRAGMDLIAQAMSGIMQLTAGADGRPGRVPMAAADISTGLYTAIGILAALAARQRTGRGQRVDLSLLDSMLAMMPMETAGYFATGRNPPPYRLRQTANAAPYNVFATSDGYVTVVAAAQPLWEALCRVIGREDLNDDPRFSSSGARIHNLHALEAELIPIFAADTAANWLARMDAARIPCSPVLELEAILEHPHLVARHTHVAPREGPVAAQRVIAAPIRLSDTPVDVRCSAPSLGQDTAAILASLQASKDWPTHARTQ
jgi:crotonobetainyl-CoA:carnitine CoA-transferase CaiB-like acyl-CoA transferase